MNQSLTWPVVPIITSGGTNSFLQIQLNPEEGAGKLQVYLLEVLGVEHFFSV